MLQICCNARQGLQQLPNADFRTPARMVIGNEQQRTSELTASPGPGPFWTFVEWQLRLLRHREWLLQIQP